VPSVGAPEILVIIVLALIIFGPRRLPEIGRTVGKSMREFRRAASELRAEIQQDLDEEPPTVRRPRTRPAPAEPHGDEASSGSTTGPAGDGPTS
jgi:sec-independent protein translocase protein TatA